MSQIFSDNLKTFLIVAIPLIVLISILYRWIFGSLGSVLKTINVPLQLPSDKIIQLNPDKAGIPKRIILHFTEGIGLYNGTITINNGDFRAGGCSLSVQPQYMREFFGLFGKKVFNRRISMCTHTIVLWVRKYDPNYTLTINFALKANVTDPHIKQASRRDFDHADVTIVVRGRKLRGTQGAPV
jgi:hypothetical protein